MPGPSVVRKNLGIAQINAETRLSGKKPYSGLERTIINTSQQMRVKTAWHFFPWLIFTVIICYFFLKKDSYWNDEVFSLAMARESFAGMFHRWLLLDVHPPLYNILLWCWVRITGYGELATRSLSLLCWLAALVLYAFHSRAWPMHRFLLGLLLLFTPLAGYYAIEVRGYSLLFLLSLAFCCRFYQKSSLDFFGRCLLLLMAFTHLYGMLLAGIFLLVHFIWTSRQLRQVNWRNGWQMTWPLLPALVFVGWLLLKGQFLALANGQFWIKPDPWQPFIITLKTLYPFGFLPYAWMFLVSVPLYFFWKPRQQLFKKTNTILLLSLGLCLLLLLMVNLHSPLFNKRYLLVFLPWLALPLVFWLREWSHMKQWQQAGLLAYLALVFVLQSFFLYRSLAEKTKPVADLRGQAQFVHGSGLPAYYLQEKEQRHFSPYMTDRIQNFYYGLLYQQQQAVSGVAIDQLASLPRPYVLQTTALSRKALEDLLQEAGVQKFSIRAFESFYQNLFCVTVD